MEQVLAFAKDYWVILVVVVIAVLLVNAFMKSIFKIVNIAIVIGVILVFAFNYTPQEVIDLGHKVVDGVKEVSAATVKPIIESEIKDADITFQKDGSYEVKTKSVSIKGKKGDPTATISYKDFEFTVNIEDLGAVINDQIKAAETKQQL